jgi:hypothetical protein
MHDVLWGGFADSVVHRRDHEQGNTIAHIAAQKGYMDMLQWAYEQRASLFDRENQQCYTPAHVAADCGRDAILALLHALCCDKVVGKSSRNSKVYLFGQNVRQSRHAALSVSQLLHCVQGMEPLDCVDADRYTTRSYLESFYPADSPLVNRDMMFTLGALEEIYANDVRPMSAAPKAPGSRSRE